MIKHGDAFEAVLFILDKQGFKQVTVVPKRPINGDFIAYVFNGGKKSKLKTGMYTDKDAGDRCRLFEGGFIPWEHYIGVVVKEELIKGHDV